jgi:hypothetical protein
VLDYLLQYGLFLAEVHWPFTPPIARRNRKLEHLRDRVPMNAKALRRLPAAQPVHHHRASYPGIEFHCEHPFGLSMPIQRHRDGLTGPVHFCAAVKAADQSRFSGTLCARDLENAALARAVIGGLLFATPTTLFSFLICLPCCANAMMADRPMVSLRRRYDERP